jgi:hypothetical protein
MMVSEQYFANERTPLIPLPSRTPMNIKNYTSTVPSLNSAAAIEKLLVEAGATSVSRWYEEKELQGFLFQIPLNGMPLVFRLPANVGKVARLLKSQVKRLDAAKIKSINAQAARTAWRTLHEWVQIQVAMILLEQIDPLQVFLPYNYDQNTGTTFYDQVKGGSVKLLA